MGAGVSVRGDCDFWLFTLALVAVGLSARNRRCIQFPVAGFQRIFRLAVFGLSFGTARAGSTGASLILISGPVQVPQKV